MNADNTVLASCSLDMTVRLWDLRTGRPLCVLRGHTSSMVSISFLPSLPGAPMHLLTSSKDGACLLWTLAPGGEEVLGAPALFRPTYPGAGPHRISPTGRPLPGGASGSAAGAASPTGPHGAVAASSATTTTTSSSSATPMVDLADEAGPPSILAPDVSLHFVRLSPGGTRIAVGYSDGSVRLYSTLPVLLAPEAGTGTNALASPSPAAARAGSPGPPGSPVAGCLASDRGSPGPGPGARASPGPTNLSGITDPLAVSGSYFADLLRSTEHPGDPDDWSLSADLLDAYQAEAEQLAAGVKPSGSMAEGGTAEAAAAAASGPPGTAVATFTATLATPSSAPGSCLSSTSSSLSFFSSSSLSSSSSSSSPGPSSPAGFSSSPGSSSACLPTAAMAAGSAGVATPGSPMTPTPGRKSLSPGGPLRGMLGESPTTAGSHASSVPTARPVRAAALAAAHQLHMTVGGGAPWPPLPELGPASGVRDIAINMQYLWPRCGVRLVGHEGPVTSLEFSSDGRRLLTGCAFLPVSAGGVPWHWAFVY